MRSIRLLTAAVLTAACAQGTAANEITVHSGQSIQSAVDRAFPGDRIKIQPGVYHEFGRPCPDEPARVCAVVISKDDISLVAEPRAGQPVILESFGSQWQGIAFGKPGVSPTECLADSAKHIRGSEISGFLVRNFEGSGIYLFCAERWTVAFNTAVDNRLYGIFPVLSRDGRITRNIASGSHDTGIYVGQSRNVHLDGNIAHHNVSGFEIENSTDVELDHNESFNNTAGILAFILPGDAVQTDRNNRIHHNFVHDNNSPNTCVVPGDDVCLVPSGLGIASFAGDQNVIAHNRVTGNATVGILLIDACSALRIPINSCKLGFDPFPERTHIEFNLAQKNGSAPSPGLGLPGADMLWNGTGKDNCWLHNVASTVIPSQLPECTQALARDDD